MSWGSDSANNARRSRRSRRSPGQIALVTQREAGVERGTGGYRKDQNRASDAEKEEKESTKSRSDITQSEGASDAGRSTGECRKDQNCASDAEKEQDYQ